MSLSRISRFLSCTIGWEGGGVAWFVVMASIAVVVNGWRPWSVQRVNELKQRLMPLRRTWFSVTRHRIDTIQAPSLYYFHRQWRRDISWGAHMTSATWSFPVASNFPLFAWFARSTASFDLEWLMLWVGHNSIPTGEGIVWWPYFKNLISFTLSHGAKGAFGWVINCNPFSENNSHWVTRRTHVGLGPSKARSIILD